MSFEHGYRSPSESLTHLVEEVSPHKGMRSEIRRNVPLGPCYRPALPACCRATLLRPH